MRFSAKLLLIILALGHCRLSAQDRRDHIDTHLVIVTDVSLSMRHSDENALDRIAGQSTFLYQAALDETIAIGLVNFTDRIVNELPVEKLPREPKRLAEIVEKYKPMERPEDTDIAAGLDRARELLSHARKWNKPRREMILLMTDGDYNPREEFEPRGFFNRREAKSLERLRDEKITLYTIPINKLIYGLRVGPRDREKWEAGQSLLKNMAETTGGRSFLRIPGEFDFVQIYARFIQQAFLGQVSLDRNDPKVHELHRAVMIVGSGLKAVTLPSGEEIGFPDSDAELNIRSLRSTCTWRHFKGPKESKESIDMAILRRPDADEFTGDAQRAWVGTWKVVTAGPEQSRRTEVIGFSDLKLEWEPQLNDEFLQREALPLTVRFESELLRGDGFSDIRQSLECEAQLRGPNAPAAFPGTRDGDAFRIALELPGQGGKYDLEISIWATVGRGRTLVRRISQPLSVAEEKPIMVQVFRQREGQNAEQREQIFTSKVPNSLGSVNTKDAITLRVLPGEGYEIVRIHIIHKATFLANPPSQGNPPSGNAKEPQFTVAPEPGASPAPETLTFEAVMRDLVRKVERRVHGAVPMVWSKSGAAQERSLTVVEIQPSELFQGEECTVRQTLALKLNNDISDDRPPQHAPIYIVDEDDTGKGDVHDFNASLRGAPEKIPGSDDAWILKYDAQIVVPELGNGRSRLLLQLRDPIAGLRLPQAACRLLARTCPLDIQIRSRFDDSADVCVLLPAHEALKGELAVLPQDVTVDTASIKLCSSQSHKVVSEGELLPAAAGRGATVLFKPIHEPGEVYAIADVTIQEPDKPARATRLRLRRKYRVEPTRASVVGTFALHAPAKRPQQHRPTRAVLTYTIRGGDATDRGSIVRKLQTALQDGSQYHFSKVGAIAEAAGTTIAAKCAPVDQTGIADGSVTVCAEVEIPARQHGEFKLEFKPPIALLFPELGDPIDPIPLQLSIEPSPFQFVIQGDKAEFPLVDTSGPTTSTEKIFTPLTRISAKLAWNGSPGDARTAICYFGSESQQKQLPVLLEAAGGEVVFPWEPKSVGTREIKLEVRDAEKRALFQFGPYTLTYVRPDWSFDATLRQPVSLPHNVRPLIGNLEVLAKCVADPPTRRAPPGFYLRIQRVSKDGVDEFTAVASAVEQDAHSNRNVYRLTFNDADIDPKMIVAPGNTLQLSIVVDYDGIRLPGPLRGYERIDLTDSPLSVRFKAPICPNEENPSRIPAPGRVQFQVDKNGEMAKALEMDPKELNAARIDVTRVSDSARIVPTSRRNEYEEYDFDRPGRYRASLFAPLRQSSVQVSGGDSKTLKGFSIQQDFEIEVLEGPCGWRCWAGWVAGSVCACVVIAISVRSVRAIKCPTPKRALGLTLTPNIGCTVTELSAGAFLNKLPAETRWKRFLRHALVSIIPPRTNVFQVDCEGHYGSAYVEFSRDKTDRNAAIWRQLSPPSPGCNDGAIKIEEPRGTGIPGVSPVGGLRAVLDVQGGRWVPLMDRQLRFSWIDPHLNPQERWVDVCVPENAVVGIRRSFGQ